MPAPIMDHCEEAAEHEPHLWMPEDDNFFEGDAYHWCDGTPK